MPRMLTHRPLTVVSVKLLSPGITILMITKQLCYFHIHLSNGAGHIFTCQLL